MSDEILDPAHLDDGGVEHVGAAGLAKPEGKDAKDEVVVSEDGNLIERGGVKYMRAEAVHNERTARQKAEQTLAQLDPLMPEFNEFLQQRQNRQQATVDRARQSAGGSDDYTADELEGYAITRGYYKDDGVTADTGRAQKELDIVSGITRRQTRREIEPVRQNTTRDRAQANRDKARGQNFVDGQPVADQKYIDAAFNALSDEYLADPQVAQITMLVAVGLQALDERKSGTARRGGAAPRQRSGEPMHIERGAGRFDGDNGEMSSLDLAAARARGKTPEQWAKQSKAANKGNVGFEDA
jgi:hypothetical protein